MKLKNARHNKQKKTSCLHGFITKYIAHCKKGGAKIVFYTRQRIKPDILHVVHVPI